MKKSILFYISLLILVLSVFAVTVSADGETEADKPVSIAVSGGMKTLYSVGEPLDVSGGKISVTYKSGEVREVALTKEAVSGFDSSSPGKKTLTLTYEDLTAEFEITVRKPVALAITSDKYGIDVQFVTGIAPGTKVSELLAHINEKDAVSVRDGEEAVKGDPVVRTGMKIDLLYPDSNELVQTLTFVVTGDANGDGKVSLTDLLKVASHLSGSKRLKGEQERAALVTGGKEISSADLEKLENVVLGISTIGG